MQQLSNIQDIVQQQSLNTENLFFYVDGVVAIDYVKTSSTTVKLFTDQTLVQEEVSLKEILEYIKLEGMDSGVMIYGTEFEITDNKILLK